MLVACYHLSVTIFQMFQSYPRHSRPVQALMEKVKSAISLPVFQNPTRLKVKLVKSSTVAVGLRVGTGVQMSKYEFCEALGHGRGRVEYCFPGEVPGAFRGRKCEAAAHLRQRAAEVWHFVPVSWSLEENAKKVVFASVVANVIIV